MRKLNVSQTIKNSLSNVPQLGVLTQVKELSKHDMIYIYHHLKENDQLEILEDTSRGWDRYALKVCYKGFKLGYVSGSTNALIHKHITRGSKVFAKVKRLAKEKYMPLSELDIAVFVHC